MLALLPQIPAELGIQKKIFALFLLNSFFKDKTNTSVYGDC